MKLETERFGAIELDDCKIITFKQGLPGLEEFTEFIILELAESKPLLWLQSTQNGLVYLPVLIPFELMPDYSVEIQDKELEELNITSKDDLLVLNVVVVREDITKMTANMAAPIIVNTKRGIGKQIIIDAKDQPVRFPIYDVIMNMLQEGKADAGAVSQKG
ncbi:MAG: flagellar assembly protein FliW [Clostridiales bacterium]|jgi:flagellar assembly factor FliW|nr:flagellar assembly protein FliW [Clostridiales bacterium]